MPRKSLDVAALLYRLGQERQNKERFRDDCLKRGRDYEERHADGFVLAYIRAAEIIKEMAERP